MIKLITVLTAFVGLLIGIPATVLDQLGPEVHIDYYPGGDATHVVMSQTLTGTNFQFGQPTPH